MMQGRLVGPFTLNLFRIIISGSKRLFLMKMLFVFSPVARLCATKPKSIFIKNGSFVPYN